MHVARLVFNGCSVIWGKYSYTDRESYPSVAGYDKGLLRVNEASLSLSRVQEMERIFASINSELSEGRISPATAAAKFSTMGRYYNWVDKNKWAVRPLNLGGRQAAAQLYVSYLKSRYMSSDKITNYYAKEQARFIGVIALAFADVSLWQLEDKLSIATSAYNSTESPDENMVGQAVAYSEAIFEKYSEVCLAFQELPFYLNAGSGCWIFASGHTAASLCMSQWTGFLKSHEEIVKAYSGDVSTARVMRNNEIRRYKRINSERECLERMRLARHACRAFLYLFIVNTGMNIGVAIELAEDGDISFYSPRQRFRAFKARASGKEIIVEFSIKFLPLLKTYLLLRRYLLRGMNFRFLFFCFDKRGQVKQEYSSAITTYESYLMRFKSDMRIPKSRELRAFKSDFLVSNFDSTVTAEILQNSIGTVERSYSRGSEAKTAIELSGFFKEILIAPEGRKRLIRIVDVAAGHCSSYGSPVSLDSVVEPKCEDFEGCLFCERYTLHANELDLRKIISFKYYVVVLMGRAMSDTYRSMAERYLSRISQILNYISSISDYLAELVFSVEERVFLGELDDYWQNKLDLLLSVGVISDEDFN